jgi:hypothetical protein
MIKLIGSTTIGDKTFTEKDSIGAISKDGYGLQDNWYGGMVKDFLRTKEGFLLCRDRRDNLINIAYKEEELTSLGKKLLGFETTVDLDQMDRQQLIAYAKELKVKGKLVTFSEEALKEAIKKESTN